MNTMDRITKQQAEEFTKELSALMDKYGFCFPSATTVYSGPLKGSVMVANTELIEKMPDDMRYNCFFTIHYNFPEENIENTIP